MTCRHSPGDPSCSSHPRNVEDRQYEYAEEQRKKKEAEDRERIFREVRGQITPDASNYVIQDVHMEGPHLVLKVQYPNCAKCAFEGTKIMVFLDIGPLEAMKWRHIDPHFRAANSKLNMATHAPSPAARFPATDQGWKDAVNYAADKKRGRV